MGCPPKNKVGLEVKNLEQFNNSLLAKWISRYLVEKKCFLVWIIILLVRMTTWTKLFLMNDLDEVYSISFI